MGEVELEGGQATGRRQATGVRGPLARQVHDGQGGLRLAAWIGQDWLWIPNGLPQRWRKW